MAIDRGRRTSALQNLSNGEREGQDIRLSLGFRAHFRGAYLFGLLAFVLFSCCHLYFIFSARPLTVYRIISDTKDLNHGNVGKRQKKWTNASIFKENVQHNTSPNEDKSCYFQNSGIEQCCLVLFKPSRRCWFHGLSEACMFYVDYIYFSFI